MFRKTMVLSVFLALAANYMVFSNDLYDDAWFYMEVGFNYSQVYGSGVFNELIDQNKNWGDNSLLARPIQDDITFGSQFYGGFFSMTLKYFKFNIELGGGPAANDPSQVYFCRESLETAGSRTPYHLFETGISLFGRFPVLHSEDYSFELAPLAGIAYKMPDYRAIHLQGGLGIYLKWFYLEALYSLRVGGYYAVYQQTTKEYANYDYSNPKETTVTYSWLDSMFLHGFTVKAGISFSSDLKWHVVKRSSDWETGYWTGSSGLRGNFVKGL